MNHGPLPSCNSCKRHRRIAHARQTRGFAWRSAIAFLTLLPLAACDTKLPERVETSTGGQPQREDQPDMFSSPLQRAIKQGMKPGSDLADELRKLDDSSIRSRQDAKSICEALGTLPLHASDTAHFTSPLHALTGLFQQVESREAPAFAVLHDEGLPQLIRIFDAKVQQLDEKDADDLLFVLKILALYGSRAGAEKIVEAARRPLKPDAYMWHVILSAFSEDHPHGAYLFEALSDPLPDDFLAVALLDSANDAARERGLKRHPFDSQAGWQRLQAWLEDRESEHFSYAHSATAALPFVSNPTRDQLIALAMDHIDPGVQMEAAWAAAKLGREAGSKMLARYCLDVNHSEQARQYLAELGREDLVPADVQDPAFHAKAEFARWLAHPNELGRPPDELEIVDHRLLAWPPEREPKPFWLIRYLARDMTGLEDDDVDCGLVGSMTWCFFSRHMHERPPEDAYANHCAWEMENAKLIDESDVTDSSQYAGMLAVWPGAPLQEPEITRVAKLSPKLKYPDGRVAIATARVAGIEGWAVLDGPRSAWYPKSEQPGETTDSRVLMIHVGRQLLGFDDQPDRKKFLVDDRPRREPEQIVAAYEKLIAEAAAAEPKRQQELLGSFGLLSQHNDAYINALGAINGTPRPDTVLAVYGRFLDLSRQLDPSIREKVYDSFSVLGDRFDEYIDALVSHGRSAEIAGLIELFAPHWEHNRGYGQFGNAAYKAGQRDIAERYILKLRDGHQDYCRFEQMSLLAEIWHDRGDVAQARDLLADCLRKLVIEIRDSKYNSDRKTFAKEFQHHRSTYLRLFPDGEAELAKLGIPAAAL